MDRNTVRRDGKLIALLMASATVIYGGHLVAVDDTGYATPATANKNNTPKVIGVCDGWASNEEGEDGDKTVIVRTGEIYAFANSTASPVTQQDIGKPCFVENSVTVSTSDTDDTTRPIAGTVVSLDADGVWIRIQ